MNTKNSIKDNENIFLFEGRKKIILIIFLIISVILVLHLNYNKLENIKIYSIGNQKKLKEIDINIFYDEDEKIELIDEKGIFEKVENIEQVNNNNTTTTTTTNNNNNNNNNNGKEYSYKKGKKKTLRLGYKIDQSNITMTYIEKQPYYDKYGIDLNQYIINGMKNKAIDNNSSAKIEEWDIYTPPCPHLHPIHYSEEILNPICENIAIPFIQNKGHTKIPYALKLHNITTQMKKYEEWKKMDGKPPNYRDASLDEILNNENYHPYDYGFYNYEKVEDDDDYYNRVIQSPMDEVPDPRRRRMFNMILFNSEFELLDIYLSEYYEIFDYFIIYESNATFSGSAKPLYLTRMLLETNRYEKFRDKIIPVTLPVLEIEKYSEKGPAFPREHLARRQVIEKGLRAVNARHGDIFVHGDLDEMPKARLLSYLKKCGGWEHLQMGIGGAPLSMKDSETKSYLRDKTLPIKTTDNGKYQIDYNLFPALSFNIFFHEYSFNIVKSRRYGTVFHPNLAIFDARRALGQYPIFMNDGKEFNLNEYINSTSAYDVYNHPKRNTVDDPYNGYNNNNNNNNNSEYTGKIYYTDEDRDMGIDPYKGYTYTGFDFPEKNGVGFLGEHIRFSSNPDCYTKKTQVAFYKSGWHMSSFLPNIGSFLNKFNSYSHFDMFKKYSDEEKRKKIINRIRSHRYIYGNGNPMKIIEIKLPKTDEEKIPDLYSYKLWEKIKKEYKLKGNKSRTLNKLNSLILHELPRQVWENPICYSYMLDREFGLSKKLWWEVIPKEEWDTVDFNLLDDTILDEIEPFRKKNK
ncbi:hypothetical protein BCR32DRAFT_292106 [Anaeromyces robustus]|uniref:Glycosyltransferase family 17 protein n=1 Tax=Anaeromyces robustus TaxID=1754192 RepID=A0A1Y1XBZ8_9FUNG|nr:hypothetical protein BCR32DRAFT_292106 [Anaeromyces robustus]|eukprot:ORX83290.1 hypothetical protein BCR32DRAFT_292106 [Anaeromyces robustus]